jgi:hypothetical protein
MISKREPRNDQSINPPFIGSSCCYYLKVIVELQLPSSSHLEFNPLILSPETVQGLQYSIWDFRKSRIQEIFISRPRFEIRENVNIFLICMIHTIFNVRFVR